MNDMYYLFVSLAGALAVTIYAYVWLCDLADYRAGPETDEVVAWLRGLKEEA